jgi:O-antigen ligase
MSVSMLADRLSLERFRLGRIVLQNCLLLLVGLSILAPPIPSGGTFPFLKAEEVLIPIVFFLYAWLLMAGFVPMFRWNPMFLIGALFSVCILFSIWYGATTLGQTVVARDFYEIPKIWFPVAFFTIAYEANLDEDGLRRLFYIYRFAILLVCLYAWAQWLSLPFTQTLNGLYSGGLHDQALFLTRRVYSTMGNPNVLGLLLSCAVVCFTLALLAGLGSRIMNAVMLLAAGLTIAMTASRYALLAAAAGIAMVLAVTLAPSALNRKRRKSRLALLLIVLPLLVLAAVVALQSNPHALARYQDLQHPGQVDSVRQRFDDLWRGALADFFQSPLVGFGPAKVRFSGIITDSEYLDVLKQFGIVGFAAYISFFLYPFFRLWGGVRSARVLRAGWEPYTRSHVLVVHFTFILVILALLMNIGASTFYNLLLQGFIWLWLGVGVRAAANIRSLAKTPEPVPSSASAAHASLENSGQSSW